MWYEHKANYRIIVDDGEKIVIRDLGPWDRYLSVTNDAEQVIGDLDPGPRRVFYYDSDSSYGELLHEDGVFTGFAPATEPVELAGKGVDA